MSIIITIHCDVRMTQPLTRRCIARLGKSKLCASEARRTKSTSSSTNSPSSMSAPPRTRPSTAGRPVFRVPSMVRNTIRSTRAGCARSARCVKSVLRRVASGCLLQWRSWTVGFSAEGRGGKSPRICEFSVGRMRFLALWYEKLPLTSHHRRKSVQGATAPTRVVSLGNEKACAV